MFGQSVAFSFIKSYHINMGGGLSLNITSGKLYIFLTYTSFRRYLTHDIWILQYPKYNIIHHPFSLSTIYVIFQTIPISQKLIIQNVSWEWLLGKITGFEYFGGKDKQGYVSVRQMPVLLSNTQKSTIL
jgi:hypothetical protein